MASRQSARIANSAVGNMQVDDEDVPALAAAAAPAIVMVPAADAPAIVMVPAADAPAIAAVIAVAAPVLAQAPAPALVPAPNADDETPQERVTRLLNRAAAQARDAHLAGGSADPPRDQARGMDPVLLSQIMAVIALTHRELPRHAAESLVQARQLTADRPSRTGALPVPRSLGKQLFLIAIQKPHLLEAAIEEIRRWLVTHNHEYPANLPSFIDDIEVKDFVNTYLSRNEAFEQAAFIKAIQNYITGEVRTSAELALEQLVSRKISQADDPVPRYAQRFLQASRQLPNESQASLCAHYLAGLRPVLRQRCILDRDGNTWHTLDSLIKYSFSEAIRLNADSSPVQSLPKQGYTPARRDRGRAAPAVGDKKRKPEGPPGPPNPGPGRSESRQHKAPPEKCPYYKFVGKLTQAGKMSLSEFGLCWYCRGAVHNATECPDKR